MLEWNPHPEGELEDTAESEGVHRDKNTRQGYTNPKDDPLSPSRELPAREREDIIITEDCEVADFLSRIVWRARCSFHRYQNQELRQVSEQRKLPGFEAHQSENKRSEDQIFGRHLHLPHRETAFEG